MKTLLRSFAGGEIAPELFGRVDLTKNQTGLALMKNFIALPHGPAANRPGTKYILKTKYSDKASRLLPFNFNTQQTYWLEFGDLYVRFHTQGATLLSTAEEITDVTQDMVGQVTYTGGNPEDGQWVFITGTGIPELDNRYVIVDQVDIELKRFEMIDLCTGEYVNTTNYDFTAFAPGGTFAPVYEITTPYLEADLFDLHYAQSNDVLTITHPSYPVQELRRTSPIEWQLVAPTFEPSLDAPSPAPTLTRTGTGSTMYQYKVTALTDDEEESFASQVALTPSITNGTITGITNANPGVITVTPNHGLTVGYPVWITGVNGMNIPAGEYTVNTLPAVNTLTVLDSTGNPLNTTSLGTWTSGGTVTLAGIPNTLTTAGNFNTVKWTTAPGASQYNIYKNSNGIYGYIGRAQGLTFKDDNITADVAKTPPEGESPFAAVGDYPSAVSYYDGRKWFAGTDNSPQEFWASRSGTENNMQYSRPQRSDDAINYVIAAREANAIKHIVPMSDLLLLTAGGEWRIESQGSDVLTFASVSPRPQAYVGATNIQPVTTKVAALYVQNGGARIMSIEYDDNKGGYVPQDKSVMAPHLFDYRYSIVDMAYARAPLPVLWAIRNDGVLLGMTYLPEHDVYAWHQHHTDGLFESVAVAPSGSIGDDAYFIVKRTINGQVVRFVEKMDNRQFANLEDAYFVDAGLTYDGAPATTIRGLCHLNGATVSILADGCVVAPQVVTNGTITLPTAASVVQIGLPYVCDLQTLPLALEARGVEAAAHGSRKAISKVHVRLARSSGVFAGPTFDMLTELKQRTNEPLGTPPRLIDTIKELPVLGSWSDEGQLCVRQANPLPCMVSAIVIEVAAGG